ncbi:MAG: hypothetical protein AB1894_25340 [Chloroflexota bacterium]
MNGKAGANGWMHLKRLWPLVLPVAVLLPALLSFPYPSRQAAFSDITIAHYPNALYLRQSLWDAHSLPLWSPLILSGAPFFANPLSGLWYPPGWLALLLPLPLAFNLGVFLHLLWGGLGMYLLMRGEGRSHPVALFSALAFAALPKLYAHYGAGHLTLLYAIPWTPWLLWAYRRRSQAQRPRFAGLEAVILAMIFLADVRWAAYAGGTWWLYALAHGQADGWRARLRALPASLGRLLGQTAVAGLLAAPLGLPLLEFARLSTRAAMTAQDVLTYSLPPGRMLGLLFPDFGGFHEYITYVGAVVFVLALLAVLWSPGGSDGRFWAGLGFLALLYALGENLPGMTALAGLPGLNWLRVPSRALFLVGLSLAALAGSAVQRLLDGISNGEQRKANLLLLGLNAFVLALTLGGWLLTKRLALEFTWGAGLLLAGALVIVLRMAQKLPTNLWLVLLFGLCLVDWMLVDRSLFAGRSTAAVFAEGQATAQMLAGEQGFFRVYSPSYSLPQHTAANYGLQLADGVDPLQLQAYVRFMQPASGVPGEGYSVTLPAFAEGDPANDNAGYIPDPARLGWLNVGYVAAAFNLPVAGLELVSRQGETRLYRNQQARPRAWVQPTQDLAPGPVQTVDALDWQANRIEVEAQGPGLLVLSEVFYPGWQVWVDGAPSPVEPVGKLLRGVWLPAGQHQVLFRLRPASLCWGLLACASALILLVADWFLRARQLR